MAKVHRVRIWSENRDTINKATGKRSTRMAYCWECWGSNCVKDGKPTGGASLFKDFRDTDVRNHKES